MIEYCPPGFPVNAYVLESPEILATRAKNRGHHRRMGRRIPSGELPLFCAHLPSCKGHTRITDSVIDAPSPLSALSAWVSWRIEEEIEPFFVQPSVNQGKASILPLLYMSVFYSSVVEGFLYEWFLHGGLRPWLRIGPDQFALIKSPFFTDAAITYLYKRLLYDNHQNATDCVSTRLPSFVVPFAWILVSFPGSGDDVKYSTQS